MGGKHSRNKGASYEREIVNQLKEHGVLAERVPLSGAMKGNYGGDIKLGPVLGYIGECKRSKKKLTHIYNALDQDNADFLFARDDQKDTVVIVRMETLLSLFRQMGWAKDNSHWIGE